MTRGILHECVLEDVGLRSCRGPHDEPGVGQLDERVVERVVVEGYLGVHHHELHHLARELTADDGGHLSKRLRLTEAIQSSEQRALQRRRDLQGCGLERRGVIARFEHHLAQLFEEQRVAIGVFDNALTYPVVDLRTGEHGVHEVRRLEFGDGVDAHVVDMIEGRPGRHELGPRRRHEQDAIGGDLLDDAAQQLETRRVAPVQVFHQQHHWIALAQRDEPFDQPVDRSLSARLGAEPAECTQARVRDRQERGDDGQLLLCRQPGGPQSLLDPPNPISRLVARLESERLFDHLDDRVERSVAHVARA